jgi:hypothetical protein
VSPTVISVFMGVIFVALVGFDLYLSHDARTGNTFSARFRALGRFWPPSRLVITLAIGMCLGHWWWTPQDVVYVGGASVACPAPDAGATDDTDQHAH